MARLFHLHYSPWSEKARWALAHHAVAHECIDHVPMLGEVRLRSAAGDLGRPTSVPLFVDGDLVLRDSLDIARHAERTGKGSRLFPEGRDADVVRWNDASERLAAAGRVHVIARTRSDRAAQREALPRGIPSFLAGTAAMAAGYLARKYGAGDDEADAVRRMRTELDAIRTGLGDESYLLGTFSYADVAVASCLQVVRPVEDRFLRLGPATRRVWTSEALARDFGDLLEWRDAVYATHR